MPTLNPGLVQNQNQAMVQGTLVDQDGAPIAATLVSLFAKQIQSEIHLGDATTGEQGQYSITYQRPSALNLVVRAYDASKKVIAESATVFAAPAQVEIDLTTASDGIVRKPSQFTLLDASVVAALGGTPLQNLKENNDIHELSFLASSIGVPFAQVADLFIANVLGLKNALRYETLFGLFAEGIPPNLNAAFGDLPDAGIDDAFTAQVLSGVLAHPRAVLDQTLSAAVTANILPASYATVQEAELSRLDALRVATIGSAPYISGKTSLNDLLAAGRVTDAVKSAFTQAYADNSGQPGPTWTTLRANPNLPAADLATLHTTLSLGELFSGNLPLINDTFSRLSQNSLASVQNLALLDQNDWIARITAIDPQGTSIPQVLPTDTPQQRIARFAKGLAARFAGRYPTTAFVGGLSKATTTSFAATRDEMISVLQANPSLDIGRTNIDQFVAANKLTISPAALADLKTVQRLHRVSPHYAKVEALHTAGFKSAQNIYFTGRAPFLAQMTPALGSSALARTAYAQAQMTYATALMAYGRYNGGLAGFGVASISGSKPTPGTIDNLPDLQALFGSLDYFQCDDCQSIYSPAAYLVDLLQYLSWFTATPLPDATAPFTSVTTARDALLLRRPDIQYVALDCNNTNITIPYIDLVNEILEAAIAPTSIARPTILDTEGTTAERQALPQQTQPLVAAAAYSATTSAVFPLSLPFDVNSAQTTAYVAALGTTRLALLNLFPAASGASALAGAAIGINQATQNVINQRDRTDPWTRWGLAQNPTHVINPKTNKFFNPANWVAALNKVPVLMNRSGLSLQQVLQLLEVVWVTQSAVTLQTGTQLTAGVHMLSADTDLMTFTGLTDLVLDRANRFLRLWTATGLQMWELDWALEETGGTLDDGFLTFLAGAMAVRTQLNLPFQEVLIFWAEIETRDVTSHLGDEDVVIPSTYTEVFANPTMVASWPGLFDTGSGLPGYPVLSGDQIVYPASPIPSSNQLQPLDGIVAALGLSSADISAILAASGAANTLSLPTLTVLLRYQRLASSLSLSVSDLILWITLTAGSPFGEAPSDTVEFLRRLAVLQGTGIALHDLDYLLRCQSVSQSALAFTTTQSTAVLQSIRDAVAKAVSASELSLVSVSSASPIVVATAKPHGLATATEVFITGVTGNTAANGDFTITVIDPSSFRLNGSAGNASWTGGGSATPNLDATIKTIVISALATAASVTADIVTPVLAKTGLLPLNATTIERLLAQNTVDPTQFPVMIAAFTRVVNAGALFTALAPSSAAFTFLVENAATFGWLDPSALPLAPVAKSPYTAFEALLRALKLQQRQPARTPKLFDDVFAQWLLPGALPADVPTAIGGPAILVSAATNATPIAITTTAPHGLQTGAEVTISLVQGNTAANGTFTITVNGPNSFTLDGSIGNGAWIGGGVVTSLAAPSLALALNATIADVTAIAEALKVAAPSLNRATRAGTLADIATLTAIANALDVVARYGISGATLVQLAAASPDADTANVAMGALQAQYPQSSWFAAVQPVEDNLRQARRDALVAYLLGPGPIASPGAQFLTTDDIFNYYLIDPEMCSCGETTRLLQPSLAIQQFVQQCFLNMTIGVTVDTTDYRWTEWSWRQQYRLWQANREVFLYPENYVLPELRTNASSFFTDLENDLRQSNCDKDAAEAAFENYLRKLVGVSRLHVAAHYNQTNAGPNGATVLYVFARTRGTPAQWYYRTRTTLPPANGVMPTGTWSAWASLNLDIASDQLVPVIWDQRLHLVWPVFKQISEKQSDQPIPPSLTSGGGNSPAAQKFWSVEFAMSEFSAGQWQAKRTIDEKMYFDTQDPSFTFMFKAYQDSSFNLQLQAYYTGSVTKWYPEYVANGTLPLPDSPLSVLETRLALPPSTFIDQSQEPSYALIASILANLKNQAGFNLEPTPTSYFFKNQDLIFGHWSDAANSAQVPLIVLDVNNSNGTAINQKLLRTITSPRIIVPQQEITFDSADPFFVADPNRTYLVQPHYYTISSSPQELDSLAYVKQWSTRYEFQTFYHPYARTLLRELEIGGIPQLMARNLQQNPQAVRGWPTTFDFESLYHPESPVAKPYPGTAKPPADQGETALDFDPGCGGAYSLYNWEIFYHAPMFVASLLFQNQQYQDAMTWLEYIFNPTDNSGGAVPQRFWEMKPFNDMNANKWTDQQIQTLLNTLAADTQQGISDQSMANAINAWMLDPFDPHMVASTRISAYGKATVMKFLDVVIGQADSLYALYTMENVAQAEQLYILADMILGPAPQEVRPPTEPSGPPSTYASLKNVDLFSNTLVTVENVILAPEPPQSLVDGTLQTPSLPQFPGNDNTLLFCIPPNDQLLAYWGTVAQRLYNIRHCLNMQGVAQPLPLYAPPINPLELIEERASGASAFGVTATAPIYRFATYLQKAVEMVNDVRAYGALILSALEKQDSETLASLRATQELDIQTRMLDVKTQQVTEAQDQITALQNQMAVTQIRYTFYSSIEFMNTWETTAISLQGAALVANGVAMILDMTSGGAHLAPSGTLGVGGFGGSPVGHLTYGGENVGRSATSWASVSRSLAGILSESGGMAATMGGYWRRQDEWTLQKSLANAELTQIASQITAASDRRDIANSELAIQKKQISNAQAISNFLTNKYTNAQLYNWMLTQLTTVYTQAYQLAFSLAQQAQTAYRYELGCLTDEFIQFAYWDSQHKGLTAGDSLLFDLRRMESQYLANNIRELELTKHVSLALTQPLMLVQLLQTGSCSIVLDESLFDGDHPGHYFRRLRSVAVTIPCVTGPYTGVNATLALGSTVVRTVAPSAGYKPYLWATAGSSTDPGISASPSVAATPIIATSSGQNDAGLFEVNLHDERWLPFEGQGAVSMWSLTLDPRDNNFDLSSVTDVVLHIRYSARSGGDLEAVRTALKPLNTRSILVSVRNTFGDAYYSFLNPTDTTATQQTLTLPLTNVIFPFSNLGTPAITDMTLLVALEEPLTPAIASALGSGLEIDGTFGLTSSTTKGAVKLKPVAGTAPGGGAIAALSSSDMPLPTPTAPASFTLTIPQASLPPSLQTQVNGQARLNPNLISDIVLLINYEIH